MDATIRQDLQGATARRSHFQPPFRPESQSGYFEYGEGAFAVDQ